MKNDIRHLTVRIYGLLLNPKGQLLVCREQIKGQWVNKFPGGGLELGEGPAEALLREMQEETNLQCCIVRHIYTTDFYIESLFVPNTQVLCIYYKLIADDLSPLLQLTNNPKFSLEFVDINGLTPNFFSLESDRQAFKAFLCLI